MDLLSLLAAFCFMFVHCASASNGVHLHKVLNQDDAKFSTASSLPRKLKLSEEAAEAVRVKGFADKNVVPDDKNMKSTEASSGNNLTPHKKQVHAEEKGDWREGESDQYFTMDYPWVRRRQPIHNQKVPSVP